MRGKSQTLRIIGGSVKTNQLRNIDWTYTVFLRNYTLGIIGITEACKQALFYMFLQFISAE